MRSRLFSIMPLVALLAATVGLTGQSGAEVTPRDKEFYLDQAVVSFVRPGIRARILNVEQMAAGAQPRVRFRLTDRAGLPLDREGITTPGPINARFLLARIPAGSREYRSYTVSRPTSPITGVQAEQASFDSGGRFEKTGDGEYTYTFNTRLPADFDPTVTHTMELFATRDLREFDLDQQGDENFLTWVPNGSPVTVTHDLVATATCNACHNPLNAHGGFRREMQGCVLCHTSQTTDPDTGNTMDMKVLAHKIHAGEHLPSVQAGKPYQVIGFGGQVHDFSEVRYPQDIRACTSCHKSGPRDAGRWLTGSRAACGACHDNVNFATGENHRNIIQADDTRCGNCHRPQGDREFDASVVGAHTIPRFSQQLPGVVFSLVRVQNTAAGQRPTVTFTIQDRQGNPITPQQMSSLSLILAGPTTDYATRFSESARNATVSGNTYTYTFTNAIPAAAQGTFTVDIEGYRNINIDAGQAAPLAVRDAGLNRVTHFSVDGSLVRPPRAVVTNEKCNACHGSISFHGDNRNRVEACLVCHTPLLTDAARRPANQLPAETVDLHTMVHKIHRGHDLTRGYTAYGFGNVAHDFTKVAYPGDLRDCQQCHVAGTNQLPLPEGRIPVTTPRGFTNPTPPEQAVCLSCHDTRAAAAHAQLNTGSIGESCAVCHGPNSQFSVDRVHAR